jgi:N-acetylglutamate synthase-like GNAT family acetyltransferase
LDSIQYQTADALILPQVKRFFRDHGFRAQAPRDEHIVIALHHSKLVAALRLSPVDEYWLLRSMCVAEADRGKGIGSALLAHCRPWLLQHKVFCFAYPHLQAFYQRGGFRPLQATTAPLPIAAKFEQYTERGKALLLMQYCAST